MVRLRLCLRRRQRQDPDKKQEYADRAMELLQEAVKAGFKDATHMKKDKDLDPFATARIYKLLADLETKSKAGAK